MNPEGMKLPDPGNVIFPGAHRHFFWWWWDPAPPFLEKLGKDKLAEISKAKLEFMKESIKIEKELMKAHLRLMDKISEAYSGIEL